LSPGAVALLGWSALRAIVKRPFLAPRAFERATRRHAAERIVPLEPEDRAALAAAGRCLACGRCDAVAPLATVGAAPSDWVLARLRDLTDRDVAAAPPAPDEALERMERACPAGVPLRLLRRSGARLAERVARR
jgi:hypothetical protein